MSTRTTKAAIGIGLMAWELATCAGELASEQPQLVSVQKIWDQAKYNSFTDLARFGDRWYCTFRESDAHERQGSSHCLYRRSAVAVRAIIRSRGARSS